jgi:regulatory protein RepA
MLDYLSRGRFGVWYLCNPVDGEAHWNPREGKWSWRSEEAITSFRYAVIESDEADPGLWLAAVVQLPLPIAAIYSSGKRSIQVLVRVDADSKSQWDEIVRREWAPILVRLGADYGALSAVRLSRLPGCWRGQTGKLQELLYLDDEPDETPIIEKPLRDPDAIRTTWASNL